MDILVQRLEGLYMTIAETNVRDPILRRIPALSRRARELRPGGAAVRGLEDAVAPDGVDVEVAFAGARVQDARADRIHGQRAHRDHPHHSRRPSLHAISEGSPDRSREFHRPRQRHKRLDQPRLARQEARRSTL